MKRFAGQSAGSSRWRLAAGVAVVLLAVGIAFAAYFASQAIDGTSAAQETGDATATPPAGDSSPTAALTPELSPEPSAPPASPEPSPTVPPCLPCEVRDRDQLRVDAPDIQLAADGKYYVPDRGDGCTYREIAWSPMRAEGWVSLYDPGCAILWLYLPATGEVQGLAACPCYDVKGGQQLQVAAEDIQLGPDGKYYILDRGDGCAYQQDTSIVGEIVLRAPGCEVFWIYVPATGEVQAWTP